MSKLGDQVGPVAVDLNTFDGLIQRLKLIRDYVQYDLSGQFNRELAGKADPNMLGGLPEGQGIMSRAAGNLTAIQQEMAAIQQVLHNLVAQTGELHDSYKTLEELNRADLEKVKKLLETPAPAAPGAPSVPGQPQV